MQILIASAGGERPLAWPGRGRPGPLKLEKRFVLCGFIGNRRRLDLAAFFFPSPLYFLFLSYVVPHYVGAKASGS